ncbi:hypothetical protein BSKO_02983 [Bryopsis sp. KO-2023]|nr:hypothetical protein BSKO_02983 [Bryopsis sp. KO-2023]
MQRYAETLFLTSSDCSTVPVDDARAPRRDVETKLNWTARSAGDCVFLRNLHESLPTGDAILWGFDAKEKRILHVSAVAVSGKVYGACKVAFPRPIFHTPSFAYHQDSIFAYVLDNVGVVWVLKLSEVHSGRHTLEGLEGLLSDSVFVGDRLGTLKKVVLWTYCEGCLCVGGDPGGTLFFPLEVVHDPVSEKSPVELRDGSIKRSIASIASTLRGAGNPSVVAGVVVPKCILSGKDALALVYADGWLTINDVEKGQKVVGQQLVCGEHTQPVSMVYCASSSTLVIQFNGEVGYLQEVDVEVLNLWGTLLRASPRKVHDFGKDFLIRGAVYWNRTLWLCLHGPNFASDIITVNKSHSLSRVEDHPHVQRGRSESKLRHQALLWERVVEVSLDTNLTDADQRNQSFAKLLELGPLSKRAFSDTMADTSVAFTEDNWKGSNAGSIPSLLEAAANEIQYKNPSFTPVMCHWSVIQIYYAKWIRRHIPVNLVIAPDMSTLLVVRGGGFLSGMRKVSKVESWVEVGKMLNGRWAGEEMDSPSLLVRAASLIRAICGDMFLDGCSFAMLKGADAASCVIPAAVKTILNPITSQDGMLTGKDDWSKNRRCLVAELLNILMKIGPQNLGQAIGVLCGGSEMNSSNRDGDVSAQGSVATPGMIGFTVNAARQINFIRSHLLSGVAVALGLMGHSQKKVLEHIDSGSPIFKALISNWVGSAITHGLCSTSSVTTGKVVRNARSMQVDGCSTSGVAGEYMNSFVSAGHFAAAEFLEEGKNLEGVDFSTLGDVFDSIGDRFDKFANGKDHGSRAYGGLTFRLCEFAADFFISGQWIAIQHISYGLASLYGDVGQIFIRGLAMAAHIWTLRDAKTKQEAEEQAAEFIVLARKIIKKKAPRRFGDILDRLRSAFTLEPQCSGENASQLTYLEVMVFVMDHANAHTAAALISQGAISILPSTLADNTQIQLRGRLWEQVYHHSCASQNYSLAFAALVRNPERTERAKNFSISSFVKEVCQRGHVKELLSLPFVNSTHGLLLQMRGVVEESLNSLAESAPVDASPQPFWVLYQFHSQAANYQKAAEALVGYARRVEKTALNRPGALKEIHEATVLAVVALSMCNEQHAWVRDPRKWKGAPATLPDELRREAAKLKAYMEVLASKRKETCDRIPSRDSIVHSLRLLGKYEYLMKNIPALYKSHEVLQAYKEVFKVIATDCVDKIRDEDEMLDPFDLPLVNKLRGWLCQYDGREMCHKLRFLVAETMLEKDPDIALPQWLVEMCREGSDGAEARVVNPAPLISLLHKHGRLNLAVDLLIDEAVYAQHRVSVASAKMQFPHQWMPMHLVQAIRKDLVVRNDIHRLQDLDSNLQSFVDVLREVSQQRAKLVLEHGPSS